MGSASYSVEIPSTMNALVDMRPAVSQAPMSAGRKLVTQPGAPAFLLAALPSPVLHRKLPFAATQIGVVWRGGGSPPYIRTSSDGRRWSVWRQVEDDADMFDERTGTRYSSLLPGRNARFAQVRTAGHGESQFSKIAVINTSDGSRKKVRLARSADAATPKPDIVPRAAWGADESIRRPGESFTRAKSIFVHHTSTPNNDADPAGTIRAIYSYHVQTRGFHDIGYNFLIDHRGRVYEGRHSASATAGETAFGEDANGRTVLGAHTKDHNATSIGIAVLGNSDSAAPTAPALNSLVGLSAWAADRHGIDPLGKFHHVDPATGSTETLHNISGHKDSLGSITKCPGAVLYSQLPAIRQRVEQVISSTSAQSPPSMPVATNITPPSPSQSTSPNAVGDVSRFVTRVELVFQRTGGGDRTISVTPQGGSFTVTAASFGKEPLKPGVYSVRAIAFDALGRPSPAAPVADGYEVRRPSALPALHSIVEPVLDPPLGNARWSDLAKAMSTVIKVLGL